LPHVEQVEPGHPPARHDRTDPLPLRGPGRALLRPEEIGGAACRVRGLVVDLTGYPTLTLRAAVAGTPLRALALRPVRGAVCGWSWRVSLVEGCCVWCLSLPFFFFSSRRRHTRFSRDWSSDVCSSDLAPAR